MREILLELQIENAGKDKSFSKLNWASEMIYCVLFKLPVSHLPRWDQSVCGEVELRRKQSLIFFNMILHIARATDLYWSSSLLILINFKNYRR